MRPNRTTLKRFFSGAATGVLTLGDVHSLDSSTACSCSGASHGDITSQMEAVECGDWPLHPPFTSKLHQSELRQHPLVHLDSFDATPGVARQGGKRARALLLDQPQQMQPPFA